MRNGLMTVHPLTRRQNVGLEDIVEYLAVDLMKKEVS